MAIEQARWNQETAASSGGRRQRGRSCRLCSKLRSLACKFQSTSVHVKAQLASGVNRFACSFSVFPALRPALLTRLTGRAGLSLWRYCGLFVFRYLLACPFFCGLHSCQAARCATAATARLVVDKCGRSARCARSDTLASALTAGRGC